MLRSSRWSRALSALFAVWFALVLGDPGVLHACPMHGTHASQPESSASLGTTGAAHHSHGAPQQSKDAPTGLCTCVGHCCAASSVVAPVPTVTLTVPVLRVPARQLPELPRSDAPAAADLRLPFANGPPRA